jgi:DNA invertase Pin-like site-specific DNA recombinase
MIYGYARVSTNGQSVAAQVAALRKHGADKVFREVARGVKTDRAQLRRVFEELDVGDVLMVTRLDRLARSTRGDLPPASAPSATQGRHHHKARPLDAHSSGRAGRVREGFDSRAYRRRPGSRQGARRQARPKPKLTEHQKRKAIRRRGRDGEPVREIARSYNVSHSTISRLTI